MITALSPQMVLRHLNQKHINCASLQRTILRCHGFQVKPRPSPRGVLRWHMPKDKIPVVDPKHFRPGQPVSGSVNLIEDLAEVYQQPYELNVSQLSKNGYLRHQNAYEPPEDAQEKLVAIVKSLNPKLGDAKMNDIVNYKLDDIKFKFNFLSKANETLGNRVPNSLLHLMETIGDVVQFYKTPVETATPYEELCRSKDLPPNLHVQNEPIRFHPETDTAFGGITAYPQTTTIVTGIRAKQKFKGQQFKIPWPHA